MLKKLLKQGACLSMGLMLLLTGCAAAGTDAEAVSSGNAGAPVSVDDSDLQQAAGDSLRVSYIDVGQGDSSFLQLPDGKTMLIDAGETEYGQNVIDYIESTGTKKLDYIIATHPHSDHIGGLPVVIDHFDVGEIYMPKVQNTTKIFEKLLLSIQNKNLKIKTAAADVTLFSEESLTAEFLAPVGSSYSDLNNYSAVLRLTYGQNSFLFTGDAEAKSEGEITDNYSASDLKSDVLKVGHHGSAYSTSEAFLRAVSPKYAVISCGAGNKYGHPESAILEKLQGSGIAIYRTDESGTIVITSDGSKLTVDKKASALNENAPPQPASSLSGTQNGEETTNQIASNSQAAQNSQTAQSGQTAQNSQAPQNGQVSSDTPAAKPQVETPVSSSQTEATVYVTATGSKYHSDGCSYLSKSKVAISLEEAKAGYEPCSKCNPPK